MKMHSSVLFFLILFGTCPEFQELHAAEADKKEKKVEAINRFNSGVSHFNAGDYQKAVDAFRKANRLFPSWKIQYNIGQCEAALRRYGLAIKAFENYLGEGGDDIEVERRDEVLGELDRLRRMVGSVRVSGEEGVGVFIDGIERGRTPIQSPILVTAGVEHWFWLVNSDGSKLLSVKDTVSGGQTLELMTPGFRSAKPTPDDTSPGPLPAGVAPAAATAPLGADTSGATAVGSTTQPTVAAAPQKEAGTAIPKGPEEAAAPRAPEPGEKTDPVAATPTGKPLSTQAPPATTQAPPETTPRAPAQASRESATKTEPTSQKPRMELATSDNSPFDESAPQPAVPADQTGISPALFWIGASSTVAFGAVAVAMGILVDSKWEKAEKYPANEAVRNNGNTLQTVGYVALGLTGAALLTAVVALPFTRWKKEQAVTSQVAISASPWLASESGGIVINGRFSL